MKKYAPAMLLTPKQVAKLLGVSPQTLANWRCNLENMELRPIKRGRSVMYLEDAVLSYIQHLIDLAEKKGVAA